MLGSTVAGAVLSTVVTVTQITVVVAAMSSATALPLAEPLCFAGLAAVLYGLLFAFRLSDPPTEAYPPAGEAFRFKSALMLATVLVLVLIASSALRTWFGDRGLVVAASMAGFADAHATAVSMTTQVAAAKMTARDACLPILVGFTTNSVTKIVLAVASSSKAFALRVVPGLIIVLAAAWLGLLVRVP